MGWIEEGWVFEEVEVSWMKWNYRPSIKLLKNCQNFKYCGSSTPWSELEHFDPSGQRWVGKSHSPSERPSTSSCLPRTLTTIVKISFIKYFHILWKTFSTLKNLRKPCPAHDQTCQNANHIHMTSWWEKVPDELNNARRCLDVQRVICYVSPSRRRNCSAVLYCRLYCW